MIQADEDVGKVAQATPVVVCTSMPAILSSLFIPARVNRERLLTRTLYALPPPAKALELFLASLVAECVKDTTERGSKKITAYGLYVLLPFPAVALGALRRLSSHSVFAPSKRTVTQIPTFDFCADIVAGVADPITEQVGDDGAPLKKKRVRKPKAKKEEGEGDGEEGEEKPKPKRKRVAKPKSKKEVASSDDEAKAGGDAAESKEAVKPEPDGDDDEDDDMDEE